MKKLKVVLTHPYHLLALKKMSRQSKFKKILEQSHTVIQVNPKKIPQELKSAAALVSLLTFKIDQKVLAQAPHLQVIGNTAVGLDNIDLQACLQRKIAVVHTPDVLTNATAELTLALLLAAARRFPEGMELCRKNIFKGWQPDLLLGQELRGKNAVIVGNGRIGKASAKLFQGIGLRVKFISSKCSAKKIEFLLGQAEVLSLHLPLNIHTHHWLNTRRLSLLPKNCILINTARGALIDERALIRSLQQGRIAAAALDVYEFEPAIPVALRRLKNVVLLPHLGSATTLTRMAMAQTAVEATFTVLSGKGSRNQVRIKKGN